MFNVPLTCKEEFLKSGSSTHGKMSEAVPKKTPELWPKNWMLHLNNASVNASFRVYSYLRGHETSVLAPSILLTRLRLFLVSRIKGEP